MSLAGVRFLVVSGEEFDQGIVRSALPPAAPLWVADLHRDAERVDSMAADVDADVVVIGCSGYSEPALATIRRFADSPTQRIVVVLFEGNPNGFMDPAFEAGADDLITLPQSPEQVAFALEKLIARRKGSGATALSPMIAVLGPKGGTGKTLTACNLGVTLANRGLRPVVVDLDLQFGDVGLALGLDPKRTIFDLALAGDTLDGEKVDSFVLSHASGASALLSPVRPDQAAAITIPFLRRVFEILRTRYDMVIVDTPPAFSAEVIAAIDTASDLCVVGMLDALSLKDTKIGFETLEQMGYDKNEITLVLNRADSSVGISREDVWRILGQEPNVLIPSDRAIPRAITSGRTIVEAEPGSGAARAFVVLAERYLNKPSAQVAGTDGSRGLLSLRRSRKRGA